MKRAALLLLLGVCLWAYPASSVPTVGNGGGWFNQPIDSITFQESGTGNLRGITTTFSTPSVTSGYFGWNNPGTGFTEIDHVAGWSYNRLGIGSGEIEEQEHAGSFTMEMSYNYEPGGGGGTNGDTWIERNYNFATADSGAAISSLNPPACNFTVGNNLTFSGGATGRVISWSGGTLWWRHRRGEVAAAETVTEAGAACSGTVGSLSHDRTTHRPISFIWDSVASTAQYEFYSHTTSTAPHSDDDYTAVEDGPTFKIYSNGESSFGLISGSNPGAVLDVIGNGLELDGNNTSILASTMNTASRTGSVTTTMLNMTPDFSCSGCTYAGNLGIDILTPTGSGRPSNWQAIRIRDQKGAGSTTSTAIQIAAQTAYENAGRKNNVAFVGGEYDTGHIQFGSAGTSADHIWRDQDKEVWRTVTDADPASDSGGEAFITGTRVTTHGVVLWGKAAASTGDDPFDTGTKVCEASGVGLTCARTVSTAGAEADCSNDYGTNYFHAFCY